MRSFRRSPGAEHLVHPVELPEFARRRRPAAARNDWRQAQGAASAANGIGSVAGPHGAGHGPNGMNVFRARRALDGAGAPTLGGGVPGARSGPHELRELDVPRPPAPAPKGGAAERRVAGNDTVPEDGRIDLLERRLAKLARLLAERDEQLQFRTEGAAREQGVASIYGDVQGLRGQSEEAQRKRSLMSSIFEANRKLRERIGFEAQDAE